VSHLFRLMGDVEECSILVNLMALFTGMVQRLKNEVR
jgi:hypothetical protein